MHRGRTGTVKKPPPTPEVKPPAQPEFKLSLEDTLAQKMRGLPVKARTGAVGYNPYDAVPAAKARGEKRRSTDLRKLSEWIRLQRQVAELKQQKPKDKS